MSTHAADWRTLLARDDAPRLDTALAAALRPFHMLADGLAGDTGQPSIRIAIPRGDGTAPAKVAEGIRALMPHLLPRVLPDYVVFSIKENASFDIAHHMVFVAKSMERAAVTRSSAGGPPDVLFSGSIDGATNFVARHLWYSRAVERRLCTRTFPPTAEPETAPGPGMP